MEEKVILLKDELLQSISTQKRKVTDQCCTESAKYPRLGMDHQFSVGSDCIGSLHVSPSDSGHMELCSHDAGAVVHDIYCSNTHCYTSM